MAAMLLTALSYARMAEAFPVAGSAYSYARRTLHPLAGFLTGWLMLLDYSLIPLMSVIYGALTASRFVPEVPYGVWLVLFGLAITLMNWFGLKVTNRANFVMTAIMGVVVAYFASAAIMALRAGAGEGVLFSTKPFYNPEQFSIRAVMAGTSIAVYSYLGFDGISTLAEDAYNPKTGYWPRNGLGLLDLCRRFRSAGLSWPACLAGFYELSARRDRIPGCVSPGRRRRALICCVFGTFGSLRCQCCHRPSECFAAPVRNEPGSSTAAPRFRLYPSEVFHSDLRCSRGGRRYDPRRISVLVSTCRGGHQLRRIAGLHVGELERDQPLFREGQSSAARDSSATLFCRLPASRCASIYLRTYRSLQRLIGASWSAAGLLYAASSREVSGGGSRRSRAAFGLTLSSITEIIELGAQYAEPHQMPAVVFTTRGALSKSALRQANERLILNAIRQNPSHVPG